MKWSTAPLRGNKPCGTEETKLKKPIKRKPRYWTYQLCPECGSVRQDNQEEFIWEFCCNYRVPPIAIRVPRGWWKKHKEINP